MRPVIMVLRLLCRTSGPSPMRLGPHMLRMPLKAVVSTNPLRGVRVLHATSTLLGEAQSPLVGRLEPLILLLLLFIMLTLTLRMTFSLVYLPSSLWESPRPLVTGSAEVLSTREPKRGVLLCLMWWWDLVTRGCRKALMRLGR